MRDFTGHQEAEGIFNARIVRQVDQSLIDNFGARFRRDVRAQIRGDFTDGIDVRRRPRYACGVSQRRPASVKHLGQMAVVTRTRNGAVKLAFGFSGFRQIAFSTFVEHPHKGTDNFQMAQFFCGDVSSVAMSISISLRAGSSSPSPWVK